MLFLQTSHRKTLIRQSLIDLNMHVVQEWEETAEKTLTYMGKNMGFEPRSRTELPDSGVNSKLCLLYS